MGERRLGLVATIALAVAALLGVSAGLLVLDPRTTGADALRTGGLAGGSVIALYALWLNDRRRRVEEQRQGLENRRTELERDRVSDERFARAIELLGHDADQVRVGALHALAGLARSNPAYTQTVLDVLCSYLRRSFLHPRYGDAPTKPPDEERPEVWSGGAANNAERRLQVRLTAQRIITDLLPAADDAAAPSYDLDLTGATLEYLNLADRKIGTLVLRYARLHSDNNFSRCAFLGPVWCTGAVSGAGRLSGRIRWRDAVFHDLAAFREVHFDSAVSFDRTRFGGTATFADSTFTGRVSMAGCVFEGDANFTAVRFAGHVDLDSAEWRGKVANADIRVSPDHDVALPESWPVSA